MTECARLQQSTSGSSQGEQTLKRKFDDLPDSGDLQSCEEAVHQKCQACRLPPNEGWYRVSAGHAPEGTESCEGNGNEGLELARHARKEGLERPNYSMSALPDELLIDILSHLDHRCLARVERTCKRMYKVTQCHSKLWRNARVQTVRLRWSKFVVQLNRLDRSLVELLRRADGKLHSFGVSFSEDARSMEPFWTPIIHWNSRLSKSLRRIDPALLTDLTLELRSHSLVVKKPLLDDVRRLCRGALKLESLQLCFYTSNGDDFLDPVEVWPKKCPPLRSLKLTGAWSNSKWFWCRWLTMMGETLESVQIEFVPFTDEEDWVEQSFPGVRRIRMPRLEKFSVRWGSARDLEITAYRPMLELPVLRDLTYNGSAYHPISLPDVLVPSIEKLSICGFGPVGDSYVCEALPRMRRLDWIDLKGGNLDMQRSCIECLTKNPQIPVRKLIVTLPVGQGRADLIQLCKSRLESSAVKIREIILVPTTEGSRSKSTEWLRKYVEHVRVVRPSFEV